MSDDPLDQVNRFVVVVLCLLLMAAAALVVALAWWRPDESIARIEDFAGWLADRNNEDAKLILSLGAGVVVLALMTLIVVEMTPGDTQKMRVRNVKSGDAVITTKQIAQRVNEEAMQAPHVASCDATVVRHGKKVEILLDLHVDAGADLAETADEACRRAHVLVEQRMGIGLTARPRARLHYRELHLRRDDPPRELQAQRETSSWERPVHED